MLVLSRQQGEELVFVLPGFEPFSVTVQSINSNCVKLGVVAPKDVVVLRREVYDKTQQPVRLIDHPSNDLIPSGKVIDEYAHLYEDLGGSE